MSATCCPLESPDSDGPPLDHYLQDHPVSDGDLQCQECRDAIAPGQRYESVTMKDSYGVWSTHNTCLSCEEIRDHFACEGWIFGQLWSDIEANFFPNMRAGGPCMEGLSPAAKDRLFTRRMAWLQEE